MNKDIFIVISDDIKFNDIYKFYLMNGEDYCQTPYGFSIRLSKDKNVCDLLFSHVYHNNFFEFTNSRHIYYIGLKECKYNRDVYKNIFIINDISEIDNIILNKILLTNNKKVKL